MMKSSLHLAAAVLTVIRHRGILVFARSMREHLRDRGGAWRFLLWCRDAAAFHWRIDTRRYQRWLQQARQCRAERPLGEPSVEIVWVGEADGSHDGQACADDTALFAGIRAAESRYVCTLHRNCTLEKGALGLLVAKADFEEADVVYMDEDQILDDGRQLPYFKPSFSIDLLREIDYVGPVFLLRADLAKEILNDPDDRSITPFALLLRLAERGCRIVRLEEVLLHWRTRRSLELDERQRMEFGRHLVRCYGSPLGPALMGREDDVRKVCSDAMVSIIIPTRDKVELLERCVDSIYARRNHARYEVLVLDNNSTDAATLEWLRAAPGRNPGLRVAEASYPFNWSRLNNEGVRASRGEYLLFLNNDVQVLDDGWLDRLVVQASRPDVGSVGALLLYPSGGVQHAGIVVGMGGFADHVFAGIPECRSIFHQFTGPSFTRNVVACTGACLMTTKRKLAEIGGFDERLSICGDIDLGARFVEAGYLNVFEARVRLLHWESATRTRAPLPPSEIREASRTIGKYLAAGDPFYNRNLALDLRYPLVRRV